MYQAPYYGECVIYSNDAIEFVVDSVFDMFKANGLELKNVKSAYDKEMDERRQQQQQEEAQDPMPQPPPPQETVVMRPEGSKKSD